MRVPNTGLDPELRRIVQDGYRLAERMLSSYRDPEPVFATAARNLRTALTGLYRAVLRG